MSSNPAKPGVTPKFALRRQSEARPVRISILKRCLSEIAPEPVVFRASVQGFSHDDAQEANAYDPARHELRYEWSFDDPGAASDKVVNLPAAHNDLNRAYGKDVAHVFIRPGTYTVTCEVRDAQGRIGSDRIELTVGDAETFFAGERTIIVDPAGAGDVAYPEARVVSSWDDAQTAAHAEEDPSRILLKRGERFALNGRPFNWRSPDLHIGAWGHGARPHLTAPEGVGIYLHHSFWGGFALQGVHFEGGWDSTAERGPSPVAVRVDHGQNCTVLIDDCTFTGCSMALETRNAREPDTTLTVLHNCHITNWRDYGYYLGDNRTALHACLGSCVDQHEDALMGGGAKEVPANDHGPLRITEIGHAYVACSDLFSRTGWTRTGGVPADQPCLRWNTSRRPGGHAQIERCAFEGGFINVAQHRGSGRGRPHHVDNLVIEKCLMVGSARSWANAEIVTTGATLRNCLMVKPDAPRVVNGWEAAVLCQPGMGLQQDPDAPVQIYSNTVVNLLSEVNRMGATLDIADGLDGFEIFSDQNNILHTPNAPGQAPEALNLGTGVLPTVAGNWRSRYRGLRYQGHGGQPAEPRMDTRYATAPDAVRLWAPLPGSPAIATASGQTAIDDFWGRIRPDHPSRGAMEPL